MVRKSLSERAMEVVDKLAAIRQNIPRQGAPAASRQVVEKELLEVAKEVRERSARVADYFTTTAKTYSQETTAQLIALKIRDMGFSVVEQEKQESEIKMNEMDEEKFLTKMVNSRILVSSDQFVDEVAGMLSEAIEDATPLVKIDIIKLVLRGVIKAERAVLVGEDVVKRSLGDTKAV